MSRTVMDIPISGYTDAIDERIRQVLISEHYREIPYNMEIVWKKGTGMMTAMHYIKLEYPDYNTVRLSGWVQVGVGSVGGKERDLSGLVGAIPKKSTKNTMNLIQSAVIQFDQEHPVTAYDYTGDVTDVTDLPEETPILSGPAAMPQFTPTAESTAEVPAPQQDDVLDVTDVIDVEETPTAESTEEVPAPQQDDVLDAADVTDIEETPTAESTAEVPAPQQDDVLDATDVTDIKETPIAESTAEVPAPQQDDVLDATDVTDIEETPIVESTAEVPAPQQDDVLDATDVTDIEETTAAEPLTEQPAPQQEADPVPQKQEAAFVMVMQNQPSPEESSAPASAATEPAAQNTESEQPEAPASAAMEPEPQAEPEQANPSPADNAEPTPFQRAKRPCEEQRSGERKHFLWLSAAALAGTLPPEQKEYFAADTRTGQPYYLITQRGSLPSQNRYEVKEAVTWDELEQYGSTAEREALGPCSGSRWCDKICSVAKEADHITVLWRKNDMTLEEASIFRKNDGFSLAHSERRSLSDPTAKGTRTSLDPRQYRSETAFQIALQSKVSKAYVVQLLWEFLRESLQKQPISETKTEPTAEDQRYQAEQSFQRGGLDRDQAYAQQNLHPDGTPIEQQNIATEQPAQPEPAATEPAPQAQEETPSSPAPAVHTPPPAEPERPMPVPTNQPPKKIIFCQNCGCKLKIPDKKVKLHVVCPKCKFDFYYKD